MHQKRDESHSFVGLSSKNLSVVYKWYLCFAHKQKSLYLVACTVTEIEKIFLVLIGIKCAKAHAKWTSPFHRTCFSSKYKQACLCLFNLSLAFSLAEGRKLWNGKSQPLMELQNTLKNFSYTQETLSGECSWTSEFCMVAAAYTTMILQIDFH